VNDDCPAIRYCDAPDRALPLLVQAVVQAAVQIETLQSAGSTADRLDWSPLLQLCERALREAGHLGYQGHATLRGAGAAPVPSKDPGVRGFEWVARPSTLPGHAIQIGSVRLGGVPYAVTCISDNGRSVALADRFVDPGPSIDADQMRPGVNRIVLDEESLIAFVAPVE
jgi:hypothetical protein